MSQTKQILDYLQAGHSITPLEALDKFSCFRLGARINDLRLEGHNIISEAVQSGKKRFAKYYLVSEKIR